MTPARWKQIKAIKGPTDRMFFQSCEAGMRTNPRGPLAPLLPWVSKGTTYNVGNNKAKRERRALKKLAA